VVLGGRTARRRDDKMAGLLERYLGRASSSGGAKLVASVGAKEAVEVASAADASDVPVPLNAPRPADNLAANSLAYADDAVVPLDRPVARDE
ncbi:peptidase M15, partial [Rhizobium ruizarguesonis]